MRFKRLMVKHHKTQQSTKHKQLCQIRSNVKMSNNPVKHEVLGGITRHSVYFQCISLSLHPGAKVGNPRTSIPSRGENKSLSRFMLQKPSGLMGHLAPL